MRGVISACLIEAPAEEVRDATRSAGPTRARGLRRSAVSRCSIARSGWPAQNLRSPLVCQPRAKLGLSTRARSTNAIMALMSSPNQAKLGQHCQDVRICRRLPAGAWRGDRRPCDGPSPDLVAPIARAAGDTTPPRRVPARNTDRVRSLARARSASDAVLVSTTTPVAGAHAGRDRRRLDRPSAGRRPADFSGLQRRFDDAGNARRDLVLKVEDIFERAIEAVGPEMRAGERVDQLRGDPHPIASLAHRAFEHIAHPKLTADLLYVDGLALVRETRIAGDDEEPADARQGGDDLLDHAVGEVFLLRVAAHVGEG